MWSIEAYQSELGEKAIKIVIEQWYALKLRKVPQVKGLKTPDYEILTLGGKVIAMGEVKSCVDANVPVFDPVASHEEVAQNSTRRDRNHRSKLEKHHGKAISQLANHRGLPTIVIFVSFDMTDGMDMAMVLQEHQTLYPSAPMADLYLLVKIHQSVMPSDTFEITNTAQLMHTTKLGEDFGHQYLSLSEAWQNGGTLPATFNI
jgi:hypothetical protein